MNTQRIPSYRPAPPTAADRSNIERQRDIQEAYFQSLHGVIKLLFMQLFSVAGQLRPDMDAAIELFMQSTRNYLGQPWEEILKNLDDNSNSHADANRDWVMQRLLRVTEEIQKMEDTTASIVAAMEEIPEKIRGCFQPLVEYAHAEPLARLRERQSDLQKTLEDLSACRDAQNQPENPAAAESETPKN